MPTEVSRVKQVPLREVWEHEAKDFTAWLAANIDYLNEQIGLDVTILKREAVVGDFAADLLGEDDNGPVVIENQLERTDHDHLGKLLTYLAMIGAKTAIWITAEPREEHAEALEWLNASTPADVSFYLIRVSAIRIDGSPAAPLFTLEVGPAEVVKASGEEKRELAERHHLRKQFWTEMLEYAGTQTDIFGNISPRFDHWIGIGGGKSGLAFNFTIFQDHAGCELYLDRGKGYDELNKQRFDELHSHKAEIETAYGGPLEWQRLDHRRASRIKIPDIEGGGLPERESWPKLHVAMVDAMVRLRNALKPFIDDLSE
jgi:hypothetical protein